MPCYRVKTPNGGMAFIRGQLGPHCSCGGVTTALCDYPVGGGKTCDKRLCEECGHHIGPDLDYCEAHYQEWKRYEDSAEYVEALQNVLPFSERFRS